MRRSVLGLVVCVLGVCWTVSGLALRSNIGTNNNEQAKHLPMRYGFNLRDLEKQNTQQIGQAALGAFLGAAMGSVSAATSMAASGATPDPGDAIGHLWAGALGGALAAFESESLNKGQDKGAENAQPKADDESGSGEQDKGAKKDTEASASKGSAPMQMRQVPPAERLKALKRGMATGIMAGVVGGSVAQVFSGSFDNGGSLASSGSSQSSSSSSNADDDGGGGGAAAGGGGRGPSASSGQMPIVHNAVAGAMGGAVVGYMEPELAMLGGMVGKGLQKAASVASKAASKAATAAKARVAAMECAQKQYYDGQSCRACTVCDKSLAVAKECAATTDTVCQCKPGFFSANGGCKACFAFDSFKCMDGGNKVQCKNDDTFDSHCKCPIESLSKHAYVVQKSPAAKCDGDINTDIELVWAEQNAWFRTSCQKGSDSAEVETTVFPEKGKAEIRCTKPSKIEGGKWALLPPRKKLELNPANAVVTNEDNQYFIGLAAFCGKRLAADSATGLPERWEIATPLLEHCGRYLGATQPVTKKAKAIGKVLFCPTVSTKADTTPCTTPFALANLP